MNRLRDQLKVKLATLTLLNIEIKKKRPLINDLTLIVSRLKLTHVNTQTTRVTAYDATGRWCAVTFRTNLYHLNANHTGSVD